MGHSTWFSLAVALLVSQACGIPTSQHFSNPANDSMSFDEIFARQNDIDFNPEDLSFITRMASIGDSYAAGIGAGERLGSIFDGLNPKSDWACSRYSLAYPNMINEDPRLGDPSKRKFQFNACSGAVLSDVIEKQIPDIDSNQQVIMLSAGGNDAELVDILNQCIFQWATFNPLEEIIAKLAQLKKEFWAEDLNVDALTRGCDGQLARADEIVRSSAFSGKLDAVLEAAKKKLSSDGKIYYTGYAKFFDEELTDECDSVSWATFIYKLHDINHKPERLTTSNRRRMNRLVDLVNQKLKEAVRRAGSSVEFVDYDRYVGLYEGRYCEPGVDESSAEATTRLGLLFYSLNTMDPLGMDPRKRSTESELSGTFVGDQDFFARLTFELDPDAQYQEKDETAASRIAAIHANATADVMKAATIEVPKILPDGYGRVFHPQISLHTIIANLVIFHMANNQKIKNGESKTPEFGGSTDTCAFSPPSSYLSYKGTDPGKTIMPGSKLRILCVGDSITYGTGSDMNGGDGNGYRLKLRQNLSKDKVFFAGTQSAGNMDNNLMAAWPGKTVKYMSDHVGRSLTQRPNVILLHAGTNDMDRRPSRSTEGHDPKGVAQRLGQLIDQMLEACPDAVILVAMILSNCDSNRAPRTPEYQSLIPGVVKARRDEGKHVLAVDFSPIPVSILYDCLHPNNEGYQLMGDYWYDFITQIPKGWIQDPVGEDFAGEVMRNGGIATDIPGPTGGQYPISPSSFAAQRAADEKAGEYPALTCDTLPDWNTVGQIAAGAGTTGDWKFKYHWAESVKVASGVTKDGVRLPGKHVRLIDMDGDGQADWVWLDPDNGKIMCWLQSFANGRVNWTPAGNGGLIGAGVGSSSKQVYLADLNGDGMADYLVLNPDNGAINVWWNRGAQASANNGWFWETGGQVASGVPHSNLETLRLADINGDGRADYVIAGQGGALQSWLNIGKQGGTEIQWQGRGGIATGEIEDISKLLLADINGDGLADYLIWDEDGGLTGYLNQPGNKEGSPNWVNQGPAKTLATGPKKNPNSTFIVDMDGDGLPDYAHVEADGSVLVWYNKGSSDTHMAIDGIRFADLNGDGVDDYVWLEPGTGRPFGYINRGIDSAGSRFGWKWEAINGGEPMASGAGPPSQVRFADINGDGKSDYIVIDPKSGALTGYLNLGAITPESGWRFKSLGQVASGVGVGRNVRLADIDGDGFDDYILLDTGGAGSVWRNVWNEDDSTISWNRIPLADPRSIGQRPEEIEFYDINGDGKADYVWTRPLDGQVFVWYNRYGRSEKTWHGPEMIARGVGTSGANVRFAKLQPNRRASYVVVNRQTGALAAWLNGCTSHGPPRRNRIARIGKYTYRGTKYWSVFLPNSDLFVWNVCNDGLGGGFKLTEDTPYPTDISALKIGDNICSYKGDGKSVGSLTCEDTSGRVRCYEDISFGTTQSECPLELMVQCEFNTLI